MPYNTKGNQSQIRQSSASEKVVGSKAWCARQRSNALLSGRAVGKTGGDRSALDRESRNQLPQTYDDMLKCKRIDAILASVEDNGWMQIVGGEHDKKWLNTRCYPDKLFESGQIREYQRQQIRSKNPCSQFANIEGFVTYDTHYFPLANGDEDPKGVAFHYERDRGGVGYVVESNRWKTFADTPHGRRVLRDRAWRERKRGIDWEELVEP